jgi:hypothetical protein
VIALFDHNCINFDLQAISEAGFVSSVIEKSVKTESLGVLRNTAGLLAVLSTVELYKSFKEETAVVIDKIGKLIAAELQKKKKDPRIDKLQQFLEQLQRNMTG